MSKDDRFANQNSREHLIVFVVLLVGYASFYLCRRERRRRASAFARRIRLRQRQARHAFVDRHRRLCRRKSVDGRARRSHRRSSLDASRNVRIHRIQPIFSAFRRVFGFWFLAAALNRFFQSGGWVSLVHVVGRWFPPGRHGAVMGALSTSYENRKRRRTFALRIHRQTRIRMARALRRESAAVRPRGDHDFFRVAW